MFVIIKFGISCFMKILVWKTLINSSAIQFFLAGIFLIILVYLFTTTKMESNTAPDLSLDGKSIIKSMITSVQKSWNWNKNFINPWVLYFTNLILWYVVHESQYFLIFWRISDHEFFFFFIYSLLACSHGLWRGIYILGNLDTPFECK